MSFRKVTIQISEEKHEKMLEIMASETFFSSRIGKGTLINLGLDLLFNELESKNLEEIKKELVN